MDTGDPVARLGQSAGLVEQNQIDEPDLLESWSDQAYLIQSAIDAWTTVGGSSALEASIKRAAVTLAQSARVGGFG